MFRIFDNMVDLFKYSKNDKPIIDNDIERHPKTTVHVYPCIYCDCNYLISVHMYDSTEFGKTGYKIKCPNCGMTGPVKETVDLSAAAWNDLYEKTNLEGTDNES